MIILLKMSIQRNLFPILCLISIYLCFSETTIIIKNSDVDELKYLNTNVDPCENFYEYACGNFKTHHSLGQKSVISQYTLLSDEILKMMKGILSSPDSRYEPEAIKKVKTAYKACINHNSNDLSEVTLIAKSGGMPVLQAWKQSCLKFGWNEIGHLTATYGVPLFFKFTITPFPVSTTDNLLRLEEDTFLTSNLIHSQDSMIQHPLLFKDFRKYGNDYDEYDELRESQDPFLIYLRTVLEVLRDKINHNIKDEEIRSGIREVAKFMRDIQQYAGIPKDVKLTEITTTTVVEELQKWTEEQFGNEVPINWINYLRKTFSKSGANIDSKTNIYVNSTYVYNVLNITRNTKQSVLRNFALIRILLSSSFDGNEKISAALIEYYKAKNQSIPSRSDYCTQQIIDTGSDALVGMSLAASRLYTDKNRIIKARDLVEKISETLKKTVLASEWMDSESKAAALRKKNNMISLVGVPDLVNNDLQLNDFYESLIINLQDHYGDMQRLRAFRQAYSFSQMREPRDRAYWDKSPFETNAYYDRANNKFILPLAMLYPIFFRGDLELLDYSHLGVLVGHETTHGFDNSGRQYDAFGVVGNLWTTETLSAFQNKSQCFRDQYSRYFLSELNKTVSGDSSLNENLADNGGLKIAYNAAKNLFNLYRFESDEFTPEKLFFIGFATTFCSVEDLTYLEYTLQKGYLPSKFRVNGAVSNMDEFSKAFNCPRHSSMNPEEKCSLW